MNVGIKLFDKNNQVVYERDTAPRASADITLVAHAGVHYAYRGLYGSQGRAENPYVRFDECSPPMELV